MKTKLVCAAALLIALAASRSGAEGAPTEVDQLRASIESMQKAMAQLSTQLQTTQARLDQLEKAKATAAPYANVVSLDAVPTELAKVKDHQSIADDQAAAPRIYNYPLEAGLDGFMPVFNTKTVLKLGGSIRVDGVVDDDANNGNPNEWIPSSFVVNAPKGDPRTTMIAKASRLSLELRRPVGSNDRLRIFYENDFYGNSSASSMDYRLRHFYGQAFNLLVGQTYTTFEDIDAWPDTLDYEGPNGMVSKRQPQIRWTSPLLDKHVTFAVALEQPGIDLSSAGLPAGATGSLETPDATTALRWENPDAGHVQLAGILREINYDRKPQHGSSALGWGLSLSGAFNIFGGDKIYGQAAYGEGIARYINDTGGLGLDAAVDSAGDFGALPVTALVGGYTHLWGERWRSSASYGYVKVDAEPSLGSLALDETTYANLNLIFQPAKSLRIGLEGLYGKKTTQGGLEHEGYRVNFVFKYDIVK